MEKNEIRKLIRKFSSSEIREQLNNYYSDQSVWETLKQSRKEQSHTYFLSWFFNCPDFNGDVNNGAIKKLIILLLECAEKQSQHSDDIKELEDGFYNQQLKILSYKAESEYYINHNSSNSGVSSYGEGEIDILITLSVELSAGKRKELHIVLENKIDSPETTKESGEKILYQTDGYYNYFTENYPYNSGYLNLFVFLKSIDNEELDNITEPACNCKHYIQINYQKLLDQVIEPIYKRGDISEHNRFKLYEYIRVLSKPSETDNNKRITIMAKTGEEKQMLVNFFNENQEIIRAAIDAIGDKKLKDAMADVDTNPKDRTKYKISYQGEEKPNIRKCHLASEYIKACIECGFFEDEDAIRGRFGKICKDIFAEENIDGKYDPIEVKDNTIYIKNNVWGAGGSQFTKLWKIIEQLSETTNIIVKPEQP